MIDRCRKLAAAAALGNKQRGVPGVVVLARFQDLSGDAPHFCFRQGICHRSKLWEVQPIRLAGDAADYVIVVKGIDDLLTYRAKCCNPIRGEPVVGYVTRGKGVAVHAKSCPNVQNLLYEAERRIDVEWARAAGASFHVRLVVRTDDRSGVLHQLTEILFNEEANIRSVEAHADEKNFD